MEEDRAATNLGPEVDIESSEAQSSPKLPRKRFVGRRAAAERAAAKAQENGHHDTAAEGTDAVAGMVAVSVERLVLILEQLRSRHVPLARSTKSPPKSLTTPTSTPPSHISHETTTLKFIRPSTAYVLPALQMSRSNFQKAFSSSRPSSQIFLLSSALAPTP